MTAKSKQANKQLKSFFTEKKLQSKQAAGQHDFGGILSEGKIWGKGFYLAGLSVELNGVIRRFG